MNIQTVLGKINGNQLGKTLTHEHLHLDYRNFHIQPPDHLKEFLDGNITLQNIGFVQRYPYSNKSNIEFFTEDTKAAVLYDVNLYKDFGGGAIVENTSHGLKRDAHFLQELSKKTGVHIISGTGFYQESSLNPNMTCKSSEELVGLMKGELLHGSLECPNVKCGFIGEVGTTHPIQGFEETSVKATGMVQEELRCPVSFHPGRDFRSPHEIMRLYSEAGGRPEQAVMGHLDRTFRDTAQLLDFAEEFNCFLQFDLFGTEVLIYQFHREFQMPSDAQRINKLKLLMENDYNDRILISHDVHTKHRLIQFGGHGYSHILVNILPKMRDQYIPESAIEDIMIHNPKRWLSWNCP